MAQNLKTGDKVMVIAGDNKGKTAKIIKVKDGKAYLEGIGIRERHVKKSYLNPKGGKKDIHVGIVLSNLKLVEAAKTEKKTNAKAKKGAK
ncbi:MAG: mitochondrial 54S ribosomal protein L40 [Candidatus Saccharibacteria bacterium]|nr:mitochondrial 54S ribosomal protein L40 [Candidatus Saccharibacteria bacterium]